MKLIKRLLLVAFVLVLLLVGGVIFGISRIDSLAKVAIEKGGTKATGATTTVGAVNIGLTSGEFAMTDLKIANPAGFQSPQFFSLGKTGLKVAVDKLRGDTIELPLLSLENVAVTLERRDGKTNYNAILENINKLKGDSAKQPASGGEQRFVINELDIRNVTVTIDALGGPKAVSELTRVIIPIDEIKLTNVGKTGDGVAGTGVTMSELTSLVVTAVLNAATEKGGPLIPSDLLGDLQGKLSLIGTDGLNMSVIANTQGTVEELGKKLGDQAGKAVDDAAKKANEAVQGAADKLKGLIPGKK